MSDDERIPPDLEALDRSLSGIRFQPRASLGPEIEGRLRRGETPDEPGRWRFSRQARVVAGMAASLLLLAGLAAYLRPTASV
ncbi:MAG TPA: hypothetical protein VJ277_13495, partial [Gemmatimonadales bacterium]|nr:hypothetical protein [Gemmatimonadales bacterium]